MGGAVGYTRNEESLMTRLALPSTLGLLLCLHASPAQAIPETWVASNGGGVACTRAAPCFNFATAMAVTDVGGVIKCVDAGNFGPVTITKALTIDCSGTNGGIVAMETGVVVNAAGAVVTLRGLSIVGIGGTAGVISTNGSALHIESCYISNFRAVAARGISVTSTAGTLRLQVADTVISQNGLPGSEGSGISIVSIGSGSVRAVLNRVRVENNNGQGIVADGSGAGTIVVQVRDAVVADNTSNGIAALGTAFTAFVVDRSSSVLNGGNGILAQGASAVVHLGSSTVIGNGGGLIVAGGGQILSYQNNQASGNVVDGAPTGVLSVK